MMMPHSLLAKDLMALSSVGERIAYLEQQPEVKKLLSSWPKLRELISLQPQEYQAAALGVVAIGQGPIVFRLPSTGDPSHQLQKLLGHLAAIDRFYDSIGGLVGYHATFMCLVEDEKATGAFQFYHPPVIDITRTRPDLVRAGIDHLPQMAEIYPIGGAGDRMALTDEKTGEALPAALLPFGGRTLLEGLIRDLEAREVLYEKLHGKSVVTPLVLMTSAEKNNDERIRQLLEDHQWFGRPRESFLLLMQLSVPVITKEGVWAMSGPLELQLKPGGHGTLWKLMEDGGAFDWLEGQGRSKGLLRQINNPVAGVDDGLLAFAGAGFVQDKTFGFAACGRQVGSAEGMNVLFERTDDAGAHYGISNLEYTDFAKHGVQDLPKDHGSRYSKYPSNTNLIFFDLKVVRDTVKRHPLPGVLVNLKHTSPYLDADGHLHEAHAGRLETSVQNLADFLTVTLKDPTPNPETLELPSYATYGRRQKTISVAKKQYVPGASLLETPVGCYLDLMRNYRELLAEYCNIRCPDPDAFHCQLHPGLGPLYAVIAQKLRGGRLAPGAELSLDLGEVDIDGIQLDGSLQVRGDMTTRLELRRVRIENDGIDWSAPNRYWREEIQRLESLRIVLEPGAQFVAEDMTLEGSHHLVVPANTRMRATETGFITEPLVPWSWTYAYAGNAIELLSDAR